MSKMGQHVLDDPDPDYIEWSEKLSEEDQQAQNEAYRNQTFEPITEEPF